jgi:hypothetical protein
MAFAAEIQQFAEEHRELLVYGPRFNRGVRDAVARAWDVVTRLGREDAADRFLDEARHAAGELTVAEAVRPRDRVPYTAIQFGASIFTSPPYDWAVQADHLLDIDEEPYVAEELRQEDAEYLAAGWNRHPHLAPDQDPAGRRRVVGRPSQVDRSSPLHRPHGGLFT